MNVRRLAIPDVVLITPRRFSDERGWFAETYRRDLLAREGIDLDFVQDNQSFSVDRGTLRGLHYQLPPFAQTKLVRVLTGRILDVAVDLRRSSPTFGQHVRAELDAESGTQLLVPAGFAHAFCTLVPQTMVAYKVDVYYSRDHDRNLLWNDPDLGIDWPIDPAEVVMADKDRAAPRLRVSAPAF